VFELGCCAQDMEQKPGCRILHVGVEALGDGDEPDTVILQELNAVQAVHQGTPEAVQFPDQEALKRVDPAVALRHGIAVPQSARSSAAGW